MRSQIKTVDAILTEEKSYPVKGPGFQRPAGVRMEILGFRDVYYRDKPKRPVSKIIHPSTLLDES